MSVRVDYDGVGPMRWSEAAVGCAVKVLELIKVTGCITMGMAMTHFAASDSYHQRACVDRLVELHDVWELNQITTPIAQRRVFMERNI